ncbi:response regulator [Chakrabartia godavariana]|nr:response regulator [Chakrabartia godavariana]
MLEETIKASHAVALNILLVDDDKDLLVEQADLLDALGYTCRTAVSAEEAKQVFSENRDINLVISDWSLPSGNGLELIKSLGEMNRNGRNFVAILLTGYPSIELAVQAMQDGFVDFLSKPVSREMYEAALERASERLSAQVQANSESKVVESVANIQESLQALMTKLGVQEKDAATSDEDVAASIKNPNSIHPSVLKSIIKARRNRQKYFEGDLFSDPSWDILLELTAAHIENRQESVTSVAIAASVPASTAIRKIRELSDRGLLKRWTDPTDARRIFVALTDDAAKRMLAMLASAENTPII